MLWRSSELDGYEIKASDGSVGRLDDLLFDDALWMVRWLVADTAGFWLSGRTVLLPPEAIGRPDDRAHCLPVSLTRRQVEDSPPMESDLPVSRQAESELAGHYGSRPYWLDDLAAPLSYMSGGGSGASGFLFPPDRLGPVPQRPAATDQPPPHDPHLRSIGDTIGYAIRASDGDIGHVEEFLLDEEGWAIRYMVVDTRNWLPGRKVLIAPRWIHDIDWVERRVHVDLTRAAVKHSPAYDPSKGVDRDYETELYDHYGMPIYWP